MAALTSPTTQGATHPAYRVIVRDGFGDSAVWADALPGCWLHAWSCDGSLDARDWMPAGSTEAGGRGPRMSTTVRREAVAA